MPLFSVSYILLPKHLIRIDLPIDRLLLFYYPFIFPCGCYLTLNLYKSLAERHGDTLTRIARQYLIQYRTLGRCRMFIYFQVANTEYRLPEKYSPQYPANFTSSAAGCFQFRRRVLSRWAAIGLRARGKARRLAGRWGNHL